MKRSIFLVFYSRDPPSQEREEEENEEKYFSRILF
jgi:hypothetical protein